MNAIIRTSGTQDCRIKPHLSKYVQHESIMPRKFWVRTHTWIWNRSLYEAAGHFTSWNKFLESPSQTRFCRKPFARFQEVKAGKLGLAQNNGRHKLVDCCNCNKWSPRLGWSDQFYLDCVSSETWEVRIAQKDLGCRFLLSALNSQPILDWQALHNAIVHVYLQPEKRT